MRKKTFALYGQIFECNLSSNFDCRLLELMEPYKEVWHKRYVVNVGLSESVGKLQNVFKLLVPGSDSEGLMTQQNHDDQVQHV